MIIKRDGWKYFEKYISEEKIQDEIVLPNHSSNCRKENWVKGSLGTNYHTPQ